MSQNTAGSKLLQGMEPIDWMSTSVLCFTGALGSAMHYLGEDVSYDYLMGVSGGAFKTYWLLPWAPSNCDLMMVGEEPARRAFYALGYDYTWLEDMERKLPREFYISRIVKSIDAGVPVLADGVVGPPEICVLAGYEDGGNTLLGYSYFQEDKSAPFRSTDWPSNIYGLMLIGEKHAKPSPREVMRSTLEWAIWLARTPEFEGAIEPSVPQRTHRNGLAAYDTIAELLRRDAEFENVDPAGMEARLCAIGNDGLFLLGAKRETAARFLDVVAGDVPECAAALRSAADAYREEAAVITEAHPFTPGSWMSPAEVAERLTPENRGRLADYVCRARVHEERAVEQLEAALGKLNR